MKTISGERGNAEGGGVRSKLLVAGLAVAALIAVGAAGVASAHGNGQEDSMMNGGMGSMMGGDGVEFMVGNDAMGSMSGGMMGSHQMQAMGSFDEDRPFGLQFIDQMIMHHEGAIVSSEHMISDSKRPELRKLAESIQRSQSEQVEQMQAWRKRWYPDAGQTFGMMDPTRMDEVMGDGTMERRMGGLMREMMGGDATDEMFLEMMIPHHQLAIGMSEQALKRAEHPELKKLAQKIRDEQSAEIKQMRGYLEEIEGTPRG